MIALFSGRFDKPHLGHIIQIQRLGMVYEKVIVVVLDYPERRHSLSFCMSVLAETLSYSKGNYLVLSNKTHFGKITIEEIHELPRFDDYISGNKEVLKHMKTILNERNVKYIPRYPGYAASKEED